MTEVEWLACEDPAGMLELLRGKGKDRKLTLFVCSCCRRIWELLHDARSRKAVEIAEASADGLVVNKKVMSAHAEAEQATEAANAAWSEANSETAIMKNGLRLAAVAAQNATYAALYGTNDPQHAAAASFASFATGCCTSRTKSSEREIQAGLLRDIFGNLYRPVTLRPAWQTTNVVSLAQAIYDERAFDRMPILGDALEEAGCDNADMLNHCRQPGEHVRGCWVVDLLLNKK